MKSGKMKRGSLEPLKCSGLEVEGHWLPMACVGLPSYPYLSCAKDFSIFSIFSLPKGRFTTFVQF